MESPHILLVSNKSHCLSQGTCLFYFYFLLFFFFLCLCSLIWVLSLQFSNQSFIILFPFSCCLDPTSCDSVYGRWPQKMSCTVYWLAGDSCFSLPEFSSPHFLFFLKGNLPWGMWSHERILLFIWGNLPKSYLGSVFTVLWPASDFPGLCAMIVLTVGSFKSF